MKKNTIILLFCVMLIIIFGTTVQAYSDESSNKPENIKYKINELDMTVLIPSDIIVITRNTSKDDPIFEKNRFDYDYVMNYMKNNNKYLYANSYNILSEIYISSKPNIYEEYSSLNEMFDDIKSNEMDDILHEMKLSIEGSGMIECLETSFYLNNPKTKFVKATYHLEESRYIVQYWTMINKKFIYITLHSYDEYITPEQETLLKNIINSIDFPYYEYTSKNNTSGNIDISITNLILNLFITAVIYSLPISIYRFIIIKKPVAPLKARKISIIYGIIGLLIFGGIYFVVYLNNGYSGIPSIPVAFFWSLINYNILKKGYDKYKYEIDIETDIATD